MDYLTQLTRATRSALKSAHTEFKREMFSTPHTVKATNITNTSVSHTHSNASPISESGTTSTMSQTQSAARVITPEELSRLRTAMFSNQFIKK
jgi:hypothetical protein